MVNDVRIIRENHVARENQGTAGVVMRHTAVEDAVATGNNAGSGRILQNNSDSKLYRNGADNVRAGMPQERVAVVDRIVADKVVSDVNNKMGLQRPTSVSDNNGSWIEYRMLNVGSLKVSPGYQRRLDHDWIQWIADNFRSEMVQVIQVSYRDGQFWIVDGQHTTKGILLKFKDPGYPVLCKIYYGLTEKDEAEMFYLFNKCKKKMTAADMLKAQAFSGDKEITEFLQLTRSAGFIIDPEKRLSCVNGISAVHTARNCFFTLGAEQYARMLHLLRAIWNGERWTLTQKMLSAMAALIVSYGDQMDDQVFIRRLRSVTEPDLVREARKFSAQGGALSFASAMVSFYNKGRRNGRLMIEKLVIDRMG